MKFMERALIALLCIAMLFALHLIVGAVFTTHRWKGLSPSDWAAWVQAIGSIAAIFGAYSLANRQQKIAERTRFIDRLELELQYASAAGNLSQDTYRCLDDVSKKIHERRNQAGRRIGTERLAQLAKSLNNFANKDISPHLLVEILVLQREVAFTITAVTELGSHIATPERAAKSAARVAAVAEADRRILKISQQADIKVEIAKGSY